MGGGEVYPVGRLTIRTLDNFIFTTSFRLRNGRFPLEFSFGSRSSHQNMTVDDFRSVDRIVKVTVEPKVSQSDWDVRDILPVLVDLRSEILGGGWFHLVGRVSFSCPLT